MGISNLFDRIFGKDNKNSKEDAKERLQLVLMHDRTDLPPDTLDKMKKEIFEVVSKYIEIDMDSLDVNLESEDKTVALVASIPISKVKDI